MSYTVNKRPVVVTAGAVVAIALELAKLVLSAFEPGMTLSFFSFIAFCSCLPIGAALAAYFCRSWGRIVLLVSWILSAALILLSALNWLNENGLFLLGGAIALALLFSPPASQWYREEAKALRAV